MRATKTAVRRLQIQRQGITGVPASPGIEEVYKAVDRLGSIQIDTVNVVKRAHLLTLWSRLGAYDEQNLHNLAYRDKRVFEGWGHAMCYLPYKDWRYFIHASKERAKEFDVHKGWFGRVEPELAEKVLERIRKEGPLGSKDFEGSKPSSGWWGWKPAKRALEALFSGGYLMVANRVGFQRIFDLTERVLPAGVELDAPSEEERIRFFILRTLGCLGAVKPGDIRSYYHHWCVKLGKTGKELQSILDTMHRESEVSKIQVENLKHPYFCLPEDSTRLESLEKDFDLPGCRFLCLFDSLLWQGDRVKDLFGFERSLEIYVKPEERRYGYYTMPILFGDRLVGRIDPKLDRKNHTLLIRGVWHEEGFQSTEEYENEFQKTMESFAQFHEADKIEYQKPT
jgi:uncharacterized protein YcaQ